MQDISPAQPVLEYATLRRHRGQGWAWTGFSVSCYFAAIALTAWAGVWNDMKGDPSLSCGRVGSVSPFRHWAILVSLTGWWRGTKMISFFGAALGTVALAAIILIASRLGDEDARRRDQYPPDQWNLVNSFGILHHS